MLKWKRVQFFDSQCIYIAPWRPNIWMHQEGREQDQKKKAESKIKTRSSGPRNSDVIETTWIHEQSSCSQCRCAEGLGGVTSEINSLNVLPIKPYSVRRTAKVLAYTTADRAEQAHVHCTYITFTRNRPYVSRKANVTAESVYVWSRKLVISTA